MLKRIKKSYFEMFFIILIIILNSIIFFFSREEKIVFWISLVFSFFITLFLFITKKRVNILKETPFLLSLFLMPIALVNLLPFQGNLDIVNTRNLVLTNPRGLEDGFRDNGTVIYWINDCSYIRIFAIRDFENLTWKQNLILDKVRICDNCYYYYVTFKNNNNFPLKNINARLIVLDPSFRYESDSGLVIEEMVGFFGKSGLYINIPHLDKKEEKRLIIFTHGDYNLYFNCIDNKNYECIQHRFDVRIIKKGGILKGMLVWGFRDKEGNPIVIKPNELQGIYNYKFNHKSNKFEKIEGEIEYYEKKC